MISPPKYMKIVEWTKEQLANRAFKPDDRFLSETELGEKFGFSRQTVRRALEVLVQQGHITRVQGSGTYISRRKPGHPGKGIARSMTVGIVSTYLDNYIFPSIIKGIEGVLSAEGYAVQLASTSNSVDAEARLLQLMLERRVDGLIIAPARSALPCVNLDLYHEIIKSGIHTVFIDSYFSGLSIPYVALDDVMAGYVATQHLISIGHRNIAGIFSHINQQGHLRYLGYAKALAEHGIPLREDLIIWYSKESLPVMLNGVHLMECLSTCSAALCFNDYLALKLMDYMRQNGKNVPDDLSIIGIDNSELAKISSLTSIVHPAEDLGKTAAELLLDIINGLPGRNILFPPQLEVRGSVRQNGVFK